MAEQEKQMFRGSLIDTAQLTQNIVYSVLSLLFETMAKQTKENNLSLEQVLILMSQYLKLLIKDKENKDD